MHTNDQGRSINRRRLLRRAGTIAAAVAGAGAVAAVATPAEAANGDPVLAGLGVTATNTTTISAHDLAEPTLKLENNTTGAPLAVLPLVTNLGTGTTEQPSLASPVGSLFGDDFGDFWGIGDPDATGRYRNLLYSPTWATMVVPISPIRYMDTRNKRQFIVPGSASFDSIGRVLPKNSNTVPDLVLDLSSIFAQGFGAVQANFSVLRPVTSGFASLWDAGPFPGTATILYNPVMVELSNFTQTLIGPDQTIRLKTNRAAQFVFDIVGFVMTNPFEQFTSLVTATGAQARNPGLARWQKRSPRSR